MPFSIEIVEPKVPLVRNGSMSLKIVATRKEGFTAPIKVQMLYNPPGVGSSGSISIPEGQNEVVIPLTANSGAEVNKWKIVVLGDATVGDGPITVASQMATLEVAEPFVSFAFQAAATEKGKPTDIVVKVTKAKDFEGAGQGEDAGPAERSHHRAAGNHQGNDRVGLSGNDDGQFARGQARHGDLPGHDHGQRRADLAHAWAPASCGSTSRCRPSPTLRPWPKPAPKPEAAPMPEKRLSLLEKLRLEAQTSQRSPSCRRCWQHRRSAMKRTILTFALLIVASTPAWADEAPAITLAAYPPDIQLTSSQDRQAYIVVATRGDGVTLDVTGEAKATLANPELARLDGHTLYPAADGETTLVLEYEGQSASLPVAVKNAAQDRPISFKLDVMPVFMRSGCNTGSCHGAARGKDGFHLSLFGFDPDGDYNRITHEIGFRRINLALPRESLLMQKSAGAVPHTGGKRFAEDSEYYQTMLRWLEAGVPHDPADVATPDAVEIYPPKVVLEGEGPRSSSSPGPSTPTAPTAT